MDFLTILIVIIVLLLVSTVGYLLYIMFYTEDITNMPIVLNFDTRRKSAHGRFLGLQKDIQWGPGGRGKLRFIPLIVNPKKQSKEDRKATDVELLFNANKLSSISEGQLEADRAITIKYPESEADIPEALLHTPMGAALRYICLEQDWIRAQFEIYKGKIENRNALLKEIGDAEMTEEWIMRIKGIHKDLVDMLLESKTDKKSSGIDLNASRK